METLPIEKSAAVLAWDNADKNSKKLLEDLFGKKTFLKDIMERVSCFQDILEEAGTTQEEFDRKHAGLSPDTYAYEQIKLIAQVLNEGWAPDWSNGKWDKYRPYFNMYETSGSRFSFGDCDYVSSRSTIGSRLCFKSSALAEFAGKTFTDIYRAFML